jgi:hypothetical protein
MSEIKVNKISPRTNCGTVQLGDSGDTITIPAGASITNNGTASGFGATGAVSWNTTVKTSTFTAVAGEGYFVNTTSGAVTVNLPAGTAGAVVGIKDYANTFDTNAVTVAPNGSDKIGGDSTADGTLSTEGIAVTLVFIDSTRGWLVTDSGLQSEIPTAQYVVASGGNSTTTCGNFKIHTFTSPGTFTVSCAGNAGGSNTVDYLVVAGGAGGAGASSAGGGGAGGFRLSNSTCMPGPQTSPLATPTALPVSAQGYPITVGGGGTAGPSSTPSVSGQGSNSIFSSITSAGGGASISFPGPGNASAGGSGGGVGGTQTVGAGNTPPVSPPQGNNGGQGNNPGGGGGGGGAGASGGEGPNPPGLAGGVGGAGSFVVSSGFAGCNGTSGPVSGARYFAGGGGGRGEPGTGNKAGGVGGGGTGAVGSSGESAGTTNTGGGGGGSGSSGTGTTGGSGIVIIRYKFQ